MCEMLVIGVQIDTVSMKGNLAIASKKGGTFFDSVASLLGICPTAIE